MEDKEQAPETAFDKLEAVTRTLEKEREFFDALVDARPALCCKPNIHRNVFPVCGEVAARLS